MGDMANKTTKSIDGSPNTTKDFTFHIGTNGTQTHTLPVAIAVALIFDRAISDAEM